MSNKGIGQLAGTSIGAPLSDVLLLSSPHAFAFTNFQTISAKNKSHVALKTMSYNLLQRHSLSYCALSTGSMPCREKSAGVAGRTRVYTQRLPRFRG